MRQTLLFFSIVALPCFPAAQTMPSGETGKLVKSEEIEIAKVWAGHPVNFAIKTADNFQCVAYYDTSRNMVVAARSPGETSWSYTSLNNKTQWDSHNYIDMAIDDSGYIHVSGNMHDVKLIYYRSKKPWSIKEFEQPGMVGTRENSVTYPVFIKDHKNKLYFQYRDGSSGSGTTIWNEYDVARKRWSRAGEGLFDGENRSNAYQTSPVSGPDSFFHVIWMWRDDANANTNHDLSHIKSRDLVNWQTMSGQQLRIPVKQSTQGVVVDPVKSRRGLINMDFWISWDRKDRAVVTYHRYDNNGISQIFNTRWENNNWKIYQTSNWKDFKWDLERYGSLTHDIAASPLSTDENGELVQDYVYPGQQLHRWILDEADLEPKSDKIYTPPEAMEDLYRLESTFKGMQVNTIRDGKYYLKWETMPINQDQSRPAGTYPSSGTLRLYRFSILTSTLKNPALLRQPESLFTVHRTAGRLFIRMRGNGAAAAHGNLSIAIHSADGRLLWKANTVAHSSGFIEVPSSLRGVGMLWVRQNNGNRSTQKIIFPSFASPSASSVQALR